MNKILENDKKHIEQLLTSVKSYAVDFLENIDNLPTGGKVATRQFNKLNTQGKGADASLKAFVEKYHDIIVASSGPRYWGFVTGGATPASIVGDWLASVYDQNTQTMQGDGDVSAVIEMETIALLLDLFELPDDFFGGFVTGATLSNFTCLGVARQWLGNQLGMDIAKNGIVDGLKILSATPHSSAVKSLSMLGIGSDNIIKIKTLAGNREAMDIEDLKLQAQHLNGQPFVLISSAGTVNSVDFDDFVKINKIKQEFDFWWHIDAAFGAYAACSPLYSQLLTNWESADSITIDNHKWLNVPYESAIFLIKKQHTLCQINTFQNSNAPYLGDPLDNFNYLNFLPENSRRLRALPAWFTLKAYGKEGYQSIVENCISLTKLLAGLIEKDENFKILAPIHLNTVCFSLAEESDSATEYLSRLNKVGKVFLTATVFAGNSAIRAALVNWRTTEKDVILAYTEMKKALAL